MTSYNRTVGNADRVNEIRSVVERWSTAVRRKDATAISQILADDVMLFDAAPPLFASGASREATQKWLDTWGDPLEYELADLQVFADENVALAFAIATIGPVKETNDTVRMRVTWGFGQRDGKWRVVVDHTSVPASLTARLAVLDADPAAETMRGE